MFEDYENELTSLQAVLTRKILQVPQLTGERKKLAIHEIEKDFEQADRIIQQLENTARTSQQKSKLRNIDAELSRQKREISNSRNARASTFQDSLFSSTSEDLQVRTLDQRSKLLVGVERLENSSARIQNAHKIALETEEIAEATLTELEEQKETLLRARDNLDRVDDNMARSRNLVLQMTAKVMTNKIILILIILVLLVVIGVIVYFRWFHGNKHNNG